MPLFGTFRVYYVRRSKSISIYTKYDSEDIILSEHVALHSRPLRRLEGAGTGNDIDKPVGDGGLTTTIVQSCVRRS